MHSVRRQCEENPHMCHGAQVAATLHLACRVQQSGLRSGAYQQPTSNCW
jgi:hypothetical protein